MNFFSNNFKAIWWGVIVITLGFYFWQRLPDLTTGKSVTADMLVFVVWIAVCLVPFFNQFEFLGVKLKGQIEEAKKELQGQINYLKSEINNNNNVDVKPNVSPNFWVGNQPTPASDEKLLELESKLDKIITATEAGFGYKVKNQPKPAYDVSPDVSFLFETRYQIENGIRKLVKLSSSNTLKRPFPISKVIYHLVEEELLPSDIAALVREVYSICTPAMHGEEVKATQVDFVRKVAPELISVIEAASEKFV